MTITKNSVYTVRYAIINLDTLNRFNDGDVVTLELLKEKGIIKKVSGGYGGFSDYYRTEYYPYNNEVQKALEDIGWTTDFNICK